MTSQQVTDRQVFTELTANIVSAFVEHNPVSAQDLPKMIGDVYAALKNLGTSAPEKPAEKPLPPVSLRKSVTPDYLISLEDGRRYKSLKRHLAGQGLTPEQYRTKWGLPVDYPMVAENYAKVRSELAKASGLGRRREPAPAPKPRGRRRTS
jgi:predicted transcriptional regulator